MIMMTRVVMVVVIVMVVAGEKLTMCCFLTGFRGWFLTCSSLLLSRLFIIIVCEGYRSKLMMMMMGRGRSGRRRMHRTVFLVD
jgi:hypothetical protein